MEKFSDTNGAISTNWVFVDRKVDGDNGADKVMTRVPVRYDEFVSKLFKKDPYPDMMIAHAALGVTGEAGELADVIKKHVCYGQHLTAIMKEDGKTLKEHIVEELGDLAFYMQAVQNLFGISDFELHQANADKLGKRYVGLVYTDKAAEERKDKEIEKNKEREVVIPNIINSVVFGKNDYRAAPELISLTDHDKADKLLPTGTADKFWNADIQRWVERNI